MIFLGDEARRRDSAKYASVKLGFLSVSLGRMRKSGAQIEELSSNAYSTEDKSGNGGRCFPSGILEKSLWWLRRRNVKFPPFGYLQVNILKSIILFRYDYKIEIFIYYTLLHVSSYPIFINFS